MYQHNKKYCPICYYKKSHGEILIYKFLCEFNYEFQKEFIFPDLPNLRFDFFLPQYNIVIEFDGEQHYHPIDFFGGEKEFYKLKERDKIKNQYCLSNNLSLFRIPYTEVDSITNILQEILEEKSPTTIEKFLITEQSRG